MNLFRVFRSSGKGNGHEEPSIPSLYGISFGTSRIGWCVGSGQVVLTEDGGRHWVNLFAGTTAPSCGHVQKVFCRGEDECWLPQFFKSECIYTHDRGRSWQAMRLKSGHFAPSLFFLGQHEGWIVTSNRAEMMSTSEALILKTTDAGTTWNQIAATFVGGVVKLQFTDFKNGWLLDNVLTKNDTAVVSNLYRSEDGGANWKLSASFDENLADFSVLKDGSVILAGEKRIPTLRDGIEVSSKMGDRSQFCPVNAIDFCGSDLGIAVGDDGFILLTRDGGRSWDMVDSDLDENLVAVAFTVPGKGCLVTNSTIYYFEL